MSLLATVALAALAQDPPTVPPAQPPSSEAQRGLRQRAPSADGGYTLVAPLRSQSSYLIDADGEIAHEWKSDSPPGQSVYLLPNGNLLRCERVPSDVFRGGGQGGRVREYDWDGNVAWDYTCADETKLHHHDVEPLPNGNVLVIAWEKKSEEQALAAGRSPRLLHAAQLWPDMVLEIEPTRPRGGRVVWKWHAWDHLVQDLDPDLPHYGEVAAHPERIDVNISTLPPLPTPEELEERERLAALGYAGDDDEDEPPARGPRGGPPGRGADWLHCNAIDYSPELDLVVLSSRELSELWFIDHSTTTEEARGSSGGARGRGGDLLFRWGHPRWHGGEGERTLFGQHDAQWIPAGLPGAGHVLVFNNGEREVRERSTVDELALSFGPAGWRNAFDPRQGARVELVASLVSPDFCGHISGAQRLTNGNTLICAGETGRVVEMTPAGETVWEWLNPFGGDAPMPGSPGGPPDDRGEVPGPPRDAPPDAPGPDGPPPGARGPRTGPGDTRALFRATRYPADYPGLAKLGS